VERRGSPSLWAAVVASLVGVLGSFLPWAQVSVLFVRVDVDGTDGDGALTAVLGACAVVAVLVALRRGGRGWSIAGAVASAVAAAIALYYLVDIDGITDEVRGDGIRVERGIGLWTCGVAFTVATVAFLAATVSGSRRRP